MDSEFLYILMFLTCFVTLLDELGWKFSHQTLRSKLRLRYHLFPPWQIAASQRALVTLLIMTDWVAESPNFPAPLVMDTSLARRFASSLWAGNCCRRRPLEGASSALFLCQRSSELRTLSRLTRALWLVQILPLQSQTGQEISHWLDFR